MNTAIQATISNLEAQNNNNMRVLANNQLTISTLTAANVTLQTNIAAINTLIASLSVM